MRKVLVVSFVLSVVGCTDRVETAKVPAMSVDAQPGPVTIPLADSHRASDAGAPLDQPKSPTDEEITASIRAKMLDTKMSANLQSVRVTTQDGAVKLSGTVKSKEEQQKVEEIARATAGAKSVDSKIEVE